MKTSTKNTSYWMVIAFCLFAICSQHAQSVSTPTPDEIFDSSKLLQVEIKMETSEWNKIRKEHHDIVQFLGPDRLKNPDPKVYHYAKADIAINGHWFHSVGIRKKGLLGSGSFQRPSLKVKFNEYVKDQELPGISRLTLNNNHQDPGQLNQYLTYEVFRKAGLPAPRCNLAHVTLNGKSLGIYSNVESIRKPFLEQHFIEANGNLYEGVVNADLEKSRVSFIQSKTNKQKNKREDLQALVAALESGDDALLTALDAQLDLEHFYKFWACEELTGHWDSYTGNLNNYYLYRDPKSGKFTFIPWGADSTFGIKNPFQKFTPPESVKAYSIIPRRLYGHEPSREAYRKALRDLLDTLWDEQELLSEIKRMSALIQKHLHVPQQYFDLGIDLMKEYIANKRTLLMTELESAAPLWANSGKKLTFMEHMGVVSLKFNTQWKNIPDPNPFSQSPMDWDLTVNDKNVSFIRTGLSISPQQRQIRIGQPNVTALAITPDSPLLTLITVTIEPELFKAGSTLDVNGYDAFGWYIKVNPATEDFTIGGMLKGTIKLSNAGTSPGDPVSGELDCQIYSMRE